MISLYMSMLEDNNQKKILKNSTYYKQDMYSVAYKILNDASI